MVRRIRSRLASQDGFTLIELLVVTVIIGLLAAIAYAVFIGQRTKAQDADAKDNVAAVAVDVESCHTENDDYSKCVTSAQLGDNSLPFDDGASSDSSCDTLADSGPAPATPPRPEMVAVISADVRCYVIEGQSHDGHFFWVWHTIDGITRHGCTPAGQGGCNVDSSSPDPTVGHW